MNSITAIASSGMNVALLGLGVSAHNVANAMTPAFRRQQVVQETQAGGGVTASLTRAEQPGHNLAADAVQQMTALYVFKASLRAVQVEHAMLGSLLDVKA